MITNHPKSSDFRR